MNASAKASPLRLGLVGLGPRGLIVLERIVWLVRLKPEISVKLDIFEPGTPGTGCHSPDQPNYLKLNTIACQLSMFPDDPSLPLEERHSGPDLYRWCRLRGIEIVEDHCSDRTSRPVRPNDFLPRNHLGQYLIWFLDTLMARIPANLDITLHAIAAVDIEIKPGRDDLHILGADSTSVAVDRVFITIGHARGDRASRRIGRTIPQPYPLPGALAELKPASTLIIRGLGLSAMDVMMAAVTEWAGRFEAHPDGLRYFPSGREGKLIFCSRTGLPYLARPMSKQDEERTRPRFLNVDAIERLKTIAGPGKLDFERSILPLMRLEMQAAFYISHAKRDQRTSAENIATMLVTAAARGELREAFRELAAKWGPYDPDRQLRLRAPVFPTNRLYRDWFIGQLRDDVRESRIGLAASPLKASSEVWRDLRDSLRLVVDGQGLSTASRRIFFRDYAAMINRLVAGPQWERIAELLCLIENKIADVVMASDDDLAGYPNSETAIRVDAHVGASGAARTDFPLLGNLVSKGMITDLRSTIGIDGIAVTANGNVIAADGIPVSRIWLFGPAADGATYYNHYIPSPGPLSRSQRDAQKAVEDCLRQGPQQDRASGRVKPSDAAAVNEPRLIEHGSLA